MVEDGDQLPLRLYAEGEFQELDRPLVPGWASLLPPLVAILLALLFKEVLTALIAGIWLGALMVAGFDPLAATWRLIDQYVAFALADIEGGHPQIVIFSLLLGGMVGVVSRNGGTLGVVRLVAPMARTQRRGRIATMLAGLCVFFDDYANTLIVGNTMRPTTDRLRISREKLAYLVDSTAAPVAAIVPVSTWVGYEVSLINDGLREASGKEGAAFLGETSAYAIFLETIPYLFYPLLALSFVFLTSWMRRDFGPMAKAELRASRGDGLLRAGAMPAAEDSGDFLKAKKGAKPSWENAALPVVAVVAVVFAGLYVTGANAAPPGAGLRDIFGASDPFATLLWGSLAGSLVAVAMSVGRRLLSLREAVEAWSGGVKSLMTAMVILVLAWSLGAVTKDLGTAQFLSGAIGDRLPLFLLPTVVFATSGAIAFATGTSWTTMAIMVPLVIPLAVDMAGAPALADGSAHHILLAAVSAVLAGAIWGDHCSPISDTTVLSSTAAACDHLDHVRTQLPYALLVGAVSVVLGSLGSALGLPAPLALVLGVAMLFAALRIFGAKIPEPGIR